MFPIADVSFQPITRRVFPNSLPVHIELVSCFGSERKIADCSYETAVYSSQSTDVRVKCGQSDNEVHGHGASTAALVLLMLLIVALTILGAVGLFFMRKKLKSINLMYVIS